MGTFLKGTVLSVSAMLLLQVLRKVSKEIIVYGNPNAPPFTKKILGCWKFVVSFPMSGERGF